MYHKSVALYYILYYTILYVSYSILLFLYLDRSKAKINYILINAFVIHRCHMLLL